MAKHAASGSSITANGKKRKRDEQTQPRLEHFFHSPSRKNSSSPSARKVPKTDIRKIPSDRKNTIDTKTDTAHEVIDVDLFDAEAASTSSLVPIPFSIPKNSHHSEKLLASTSASTGTSSKVFGTLNIYETEEVDAAVYGQLALDPAAFVPDASLFIKDTAPFTLPYCFVANTLAFLSGTRSRITILNTLTNAMRVILSCDPVSLLPAIYLLSNTLAPPYEGVELGLGHSAISRAIQHISGLTPTSLKQLYNTTGDPGDVAFAAKSKTRTLVPHPPLRVASVYKTLIDISKCEGQGSGKKRQNYVEKLLVAAKGEETRFLVRTLCQNLRVGAVRTSILTALGRALALHVPPQPPEADSQFYISPEMLKTVKSFPEKRKGSQEQDSAREEVRNRLVRAEQLLRKTYAHHPNYNHIVEALLRVGLDGLVDEVSLSVGTPLYPALGTPIRSLDEIYERIGSLPFSAEFKYDGQRAQIHAWKGRKDIEVKDFHVRIFSRHLEDMTSKYPDVVLLFQMMLKGKDITSLVVDSEIVPIDDRGDLKTFQELSSRSRKDVNLDDIKISVCVFAFDLVLLDGKDLTAEPFRARRDILRNRLPDYTPTSQHAARFAHVDNCESESGPLAVEEFWERAVESRSEGLMIKILDSQVLEDVENNGSRKRPLSAVYDADKRTFSWMKLKKDYVTGLGDSLDLIPIGAWHGNGRKAQWWSPILLGLWDPDTNQPVAVCKCMSGFTDAFYKVLNERYPLTGDSDTCSSRPMWGCEVGGLKPEVYFKPQEVWEIRGADVTLSPVSVAATGLVSPDRGLSLRFPRFIKNRPDKAVPNASTPEFLAGMWRSQQSKAPQEAGNDEGDLVDAEVDSDDSSGNAEV